MRNKSECGLIHMPSTPVGLKEFCELNFLQSGTYNGGFVGVRECASSRRFLEWWQDRLRTHCRHAVREGMHYDQRWLDFAPALVEDLYLVRHSGYNVAYWNLHEHNVILDEDILRVDDCPCGFFHFSGFDPERPARVTKYWPEMTMAEVYPADVLFDHYRRLLDEAGYGTTRSWRWAYDHFDNGVPTPGLARRVHAELGKRRAVRRSASDCGACQLLPVADGACGGWPYTALVVHL
jgi:hypothetical protein